MITKDDQNHRHATLEQRVRWQPKKLSPRASRRPLSKNRRRKAIRALLAVFSLDFQATLSSESFTSQLLVRAQ